MGHARTRSLLLFGATTALAILYACVGGDPSSTDGDGSGDRDSGAGSETGSLDGSTEQPDAAPCVPDLGCEIPCRIGRTVCPGPTTTVCEPRQNIPDGTECGDASICRVGECLDPTWAQWPMPSFPGVIDGGPVPTYPVEPGSALLVVRDSVTNLLWTTDGPTAQTWAQAKAYCDNLNNFGSTWRLPTIIEAVSVGDVSLSTGIANALGTVPTGIWSATPVASSAGRHWTIANLRTVSSEDSEPHSVRCVR